jgi:hypothetical protein
MAGDVETAEACTGGCARRDGITCGPDGCDIAMGLYPYARGPRDMTCRGDTCMRADGITCAPDECDIDLGIYELPQDRDRA